MGGGGFEKCRWMGRDAPHAPSLWETLYIFFNLSLTYLLYNLQGNTNVTHIFTDDILFSLTVEFCQDVRRNIRKK